MFLEVAKIFLKPVDSLAENKIAVGNHNLMPPELVVHIQPREDEDTCYFEDTRYFNVALKKAGEPASFSAHTNSGITFAIDTDT